MLLQEDPVELIQHTVSNFGISADRAAISRTDGLLSDIRAQRDSQLRDAEVALKQLSRQHNILSSQHAEALASHSSKTHAIRIVELDTQKFRIAKAASELEIESERLETELATLKARLQELDMQGVEGGDASRTGRAAESEVVLKLKIYRMFGIDIQPDEAGNFTKAVIRNASKGDVHVVDINPKSSRYYYANYFWNTM